MQKTVAFLSSIPLVQELQDQELQDQELQEPESLKRMRKIAFEKLLDLGLPSRKNEAYRYMQLTSLYAEIFERPKVCNLQKADILPHVLAECRHSHIVFVNGRYDALLSDLTAINSHLKILSTKDAWRSYSALLKNSMNKMFKTCTNPFVCLNASHHDEGVFLYLGPRCVQEKPVQILSLVDDTGWSMPRLHLFAGVSSEISLVHTKHVLADVKYVYNAAFDFALEDNAQVRFEEVATSHRDSSISFEAIDASIKRSSRFCHTFVENSENSRRDIKAELLGEGADVLLSGVWMLAKEQEAHTNVLVEHHAPHCTSMQLYKGVLSGKAKSSFRGKIYVQKEAQKTESYQLNNNLLLSEEAEANSCPNLEIFADDVKASHGATVGKLEDELLFYMKSRGISEREARNFLIKGFCEEVVAKLCMPLLQERAYSTLCNFLEPSP